MKRSIETRTMAFAAPLVTAHGTIDERPIAVVTMQDGEFLGRGEAATLPGFGLEDQNTAVTELQRWVESGAIPRTPAASAAVATAKSNLDASAKRIGLAEHLCGQPPMRSVATQAVIGDSSSEDTVRHAVGAVAAGHSTIKIKVAVRGAEDDVGRIVATRAAVGDSVAIRLDANGGWTAPTAEWALRRLADLDIDYVEEPTGDVTDFARLARVAGVPVAIDEHARDSALLDSLGDDISAVVIKPAVLGGPAAGYELALMLLSRGIRAVVGSFMDGPVGLSAAIELAAAVGTNEVHGLGTASLFTDVFPANQYPSNGMVSPTWPPS